MPQVTIPQRNREFSSSNYSEWLGDIVDSFNIELTPKGMVRPSPRLYPHTTSDDVATMDIPRAILSSEAENAAKFYAATADRIFKSSSQASQMASDTLTNSPTGLLDPDMVNYGKNSSGLDILIVSTPSNLARFDYDFSTTSWDPDWWTDTVLNNGLAQSSLSTGYPHPLLVYGNAPFLFIGDKNKLHSISRPGTSASPTLPTDVQNARLTFANNRYIVWLKEANSGHIYIGLRSLHRFFGDWENDEVAEYNPITESVRIFRVPNGLAVGFRGPDDQLHILDTQGVLSRFTGNGFKEYNQFPVGRVNNSTNLLVHRNGIISSAKRTYFNVRSIGNVISAIGPAMKGGVWVLEHDTNNLYHYCAPTLSRTSQTDFGLPEVDTTPGAISFGASGPTNLRVGTRVYKNDNTVVAGLWDTIAPSGTTVSSETRGFLVTSKIMAGAVNNIWRNVAVKYNPFTTGAVTGRIWVKGRYQDGKKSSTPLTGTWVSATRFTTSDDISNISVGDEIFIIRGQGGGLLTHISAITSGTPNTIDIDEGLSISPSGTFRFVVEPWIKLGDTTDATKMNLVSDFKESPFGEWVQVKIWIKSSFAVNEIQIGYEPNLQVEK